MWRISALGIPRVPSVGNTVYSTRRNHTLFQHPLRYFSTIFMQRRGLEQHNPILVSPVLFPVQMRENSPHRGFVRRQFGRTRHVPIVSKDPHLFAGIIRTDKRNHSQRQSVKHGPVNQRKCPEFSEVLSRHALAALPRRYDHPQAILLRLNLRGRPWPWQYAAQRGRLRTGCFERRGRDPTGVV